MLTAWAKRVGSIQRNDAAGLPYFSSLTSSTKALIQAKDAGGNTRYVNASTTSAGDSFIESAIVATGSSASYGVAVGSDGTEPTENDYTLGAQITGLTASVSSTDIYDETTGKYIKHLTYTISNNTGSSVTIREIGRFCAKYNTDSYGGTPTSTSAQKRCFMSDRTVLESPVIIADGSVGVISYDFAY